MNLMFAEWANRGLNQWTIVQRTQTVMSGTSSYNLGTDVIDVCLWPYAGNGGSFSLILP